LVDYTRGWWISGDGSGGLTTHFREDISPSQLGDEGVTIATEFSALNYKDALALTGSPGVVRSTPLIPGIDAAGVVLESTDERWVPGDRVVVTGWGYGEKRHGGLATTLVAEANHLQKIPETLSTFHAAAYGTAGITAALAVRALERAGLTPETATAPIAVTGAAGAVGSFAVFLLAQRGFTVTAITGRTDEAEYLRVLGATDVVSRQEILSAPKRPLLPEQFAGAIDQAGGTMLATLLASTLENGVVASCGLAGGSDLPTTVLPFILRGISLIGINSVYQPQDVREKLWAQCAQSAGNIPWDLMTQQVALRQAKDEAAHVLAGVTRGRVVIDTQN